MSYTHYLEARGCTLTEAEWQALKVWNVVDGRTGVTVAKGLTARGAYRSMCRRDNAFGGYRYRMEYAG